MGVFGLTQSISAGKDGMSVQVDLLLSFIPNLFHVSNY